jgi:serine/threonine protein kinase
MPFSAGDKLGPYEIVAPIGKGGMGEVYRGTDTRLGRPVAIKISAREFSDRFEREAHAISALNHPHICTLSCSCRAIHDFQRTNRALRLIDGIIRQKVACGNANS